MQSNPFSFSPSFLWSPLSLSFSTSSSTHDITCPIIREGRKRVCPLAVSSWVPVLLAVWATVCPHPKKGLVGSLEEI